MGIAFRRQTLHPRDLRALSVIAFNRAGLHQIRRSRLAGEGGVSGDDDVGWADVFAGKRAPTMEWCASIGFAFDRAGIHHICRSRLAGEGGVSGDDDVGWANVFAGKRAPTGELRAMKQDCSIRLLQHSHEIRAQKKRRATEWDGVLCVRGVSRTASNPAASTRQPPTPAARSGKPWGWRV